MLEEDITAFILQMSGSGTAGFKRIAVTEDQVEELGLITQPRKATDNKPYAGIFGDTSITCQAEAIPPNELARIVMEEVEALIDKDAHQEALDHEEETQTELSEKFAPLMDE